jgi:butyryl-CoA dehydrogenase
MDLSFNTEERLIKKMIDDFIKKEIIPHAKEIDNGTFPEEFGIITKLGKIGVMGMGIPAKYGGSELSSVSQTIIMEELSKACASTSVTMGAHASLACFPIVNFASELIKEKYLPKLASGEWLGAFALTEPNAGSDAMNVQTTAKLVGDEWVINGSKIFITNGGKADLLVIVATTDKSLGYKGLNLFIVESKSKGFYIGKKEDKLGIRGSNTVELIFRDLRIPKENIIGKESDGFKYAMATFDSGRIGIGVQGVGIAQAALDDCLKFVKEREQFGQKIQKFQMIQDKLATMKCEIDAARWLCMHAAWLKDNKQNYSLQSAMAKLQGSKIAVDVTREAIQIHGGYGFIRDYNVERYYRDAKVTEIYEGTSEVQKIVIANNITGRMPK